MASQNINEMVVLLKKTILSDLSDDIGDAKILLNKFKVSPPKNKIDTLSLFLSMEACWVRFQKS